MSEENLGDVLNDREGYLQYKRMKAIQKLSERTHLTLAQIAQLVSHPDHGDAIKDITLQEILDTASPSESESDEEEPEPSAAPRAKKVSKKAAKKAAKKATKATKKPAKKAAKKATKKPAAAKKASGKKADFGKKKPRLQRDQGYKEILAALKAHGQPAGRKVLEDATGFPAVQVRTFCKELEQQGKVKILGKGGRSTQYALA